MNKYNKFCNFLGLTSVISFIQMCYHGFQYHSVLSSLIFIYIQIWCYIYGDTVLIYVEKMFDLLINKIGLERVNDYILTKFNSQFKYRPFKTKISDKPVFTNPTAKHPAVKQEADWCPDVIDLTGDSETKLDRRHSD